MNISNAPTAMARVPTEKIHLVLLDDERLLVDTLTTGLNSQPDMSVVYAGDDCETGVRACLETTPEVALIDADLRDRDPFDLAKEVSARQRRTRFLFLAHQVSDVTVERAIRVQAFGLLLKQEPFEVLTECVRRINRGDYCFSSEISRRVVYNREDHSYEMRHPTGFSELTNRQLEVVKYLARGRTVQEVADQMQLSKKSIDSHKYRIMAKLGLHNRVELTRLAIREGLIDA